jgi:hypothetical protein
MKEREHLCIELLVENHAVKARCVREDLRILGGQSERNGRDEREVPGIRHHVILVRRRQVAVNRGNFAVRYPAAAKFGDPELHRHLDPGKTVASKENRGRFGNDGGLDPRIVCEFLGGKLLSADLLAPAPR